VGSSLCSTHKNCARGTDVSAGHDGAGDWDKEDAYEAQLRKERGEPEVPFVLFGAS
jgi:hypothetical protein